MDQRSKGKSKTRKLLEENRKEDYEPQKATISEIGHKKKTYKREKGCTGSHGI